MRARRGPNPAQGPRDALAPGTGATLPRVPRRPGRISGAVPALVLGVAAAACNRGRPEFPCREARVCVLAGQQGTCEAPGFCAFPDPACRRGRRFGTFAPATLADRCIDLSACGDRVVDPGEECDDGNQRDGDGCTSRCVRCGDTEGDARMSWSGSGHCYVRHDAPIPWREALDACIASDGHLATFASIYEDDAVRRALLPSGASSSLWIGLHDRTTEGAFEWVTGEEVLVRHFLPKTGALDPAGDLDCVASSPTASPPLTLPESLHTWTVRACGESLPFLCERPAWRVRPETRHAYRLTPRPLPFAEARRACEAWGAHLTTVNDRDEHTFIVGLVSSEVWLGATAESPGQFRWLTGEPFTAGHFAPNEPDNFGGYQRALLLGGERLWHDRAESEPHPGLCEAEPK